MKKTFKFDTIKNRESNRRNNYGLFEKRNIKYCG